MIPEKIGCIFDMDGVLFLSSDIHYQAYCEALAAEHVEVLDYRELSGMRTDSAIQKIFNKGLPVSFATCRLLFFTIN